MANIKSDDVLISLGSKSESAQQEKHFVMKLLSETVSKIMSRDLITVKPTSLLVDVVDVFEKIDIHHIPVVDDAGCCVGIISSSDYQQLQNNFTKLRMHDFEAKNKRFFDSLLARDVMTSPVIQLHSTDNIGKAISIFLKNLIRAIVIQDDGICKGIITPYDILEIIHDENG